MKGTAFIYSCYFYRQTMTMQIDQISKKGFKITKMKSGKTIYTFILLVWGYFVGLWVQTVYSKKQILVSRPVSCVMRLVVVFYVIVKRFLIVGFFFCIVLNRCRRARALRDKEERTDRLLIKAIIKTWKDIKQQRETQKFINTPVKLQVMT